MIDRARILQLIPHAGASCLLHAAPHWSETAIHCTALSHLDPGNPLRRAGRLATVCGAEYGMQAAALHGALLGGGAARRGYLVALRSVEIGVERLDDPAFGLLRIEARLEQAGAAGQVYDFQLRAESGQPLLQGRGTVVLQDAAA